MSNERDGVTGEGPDPAVDPSDEVRPEAPDTAAADEGAVDGLPRSVDSGVDPDDEPDDEPDDAERAQDATGGAREPVTVGAASRATAGSARAAARRSAVPAATARKGAPTRSRDEDRESKGNIFTRIQRYLREVVSEMRKVIWPTSKEMTTYAIVVLIFLIFMVALVAGLDILFSKGVLAIFG